MDPRGTLGRIYKEDHYTLLHTKYESSGPCGFGGEDFFKVFPMTPPRGGARMDPRGTVGRIYKEDHFTLQLTKYESSGPCDFGEEDFFYVLPMTPTRARPVWTPGARLAGFIKRNTIYCYKQNMKALGHVISEKKI